MSKNIASMLSISKFNDFIQIIGVIGLIASLIFVGLELRQSQKLLWRKPNKKEITQFGNK